MPGAPIATGRLRNLAIVAHVDAGKTTLTERILFDAGLQRWMGEVEHGTAAMDWLPEEQERRISITAAATRVVWRQHVLQIVDTPGHVDFIAEVERCLRVVDGAVVLIDGVRGIESQTVTVWSEADHWSVPRLCFVNKLDRAGADYEGLLQGLRERFGVRPVAVVVPALDPSNGLAGLLDAVTGAVQWYRGTAPTESERQEIRRRFQVANERVVEAAADLDPSVMADVVAERPVSPERLRDAIRSGCLGGALVPTLCGSALHNRGVDWLLDAMCDLLPSPLDRSRRPIDPEPPPDPAAPFCGYLFKVQHCGAEVWSFVRVFRGVLRQRDTFHCARVPGAAFAAAELWIMHAGTHHQVTAAGPGEIVVIPGDLGLRTGDTLHQPGAPIELSAAVFPEPVLAATFEPLAAADAGRILGALHELELDDPTLRIECESGTGLPIVHGMGELHLDVVASRLRARIGPVFQRSGLRVDRRETVKAVGRAGAEARMSRDGEESSAVVELEIGPSTAGNRVRAAAGLGTQPLVGAVLRELESRLATGLRTAAPAQGVTIELLGLELRGRQPDPAAAEVLVLQAASVALDRALAQAGIVVLQPWVVFAVRCPEESCSVVLADLAARGGTIRLVSAGRLGARIEGRGPLAAFLGYVTRLRSLTRGQGVADLLPDGYGPDPSSAPE